MAKKHSAQSKESRKDRNRGEKRARKAQFFAESAEQAEQADEVANPEEEQGSDYEFEAAEEVVPVVEESDKEEEKESEDDEEEQPVVDVPVAGNILFQPSWPERVVEDSDSDDQEPEDEELGLKQMIVTGGQTVEEVEAESESEIDDIMGEAGEDEMSEKTESDCEVESSEDDLQITENKQVQANYANEEASGDEGYPG